MPDRTKTEMIIIGPDLPTAELDRLLMPAALALRAGELVAFPTETVYGLGADALNPTAVDAIFAAKGRPGDNPLIVHVAHVEDIQRLTTTVPPLAVLLLDAFAPGPLTLILPRSALVPDNVTAGLDTVAVRIPAHPVARRLIELSGVPVAAPSANRSGRPSPTRAWHVADDLDGLIPFIIDGGACEFGLESTVLDLTGPVPQILRPGAITAEAIAQVTGQANDDGPATPATASLAPRSPGMKYRHYAPKARLLVVGQPEMAARASSIVRMLADLENDQATAGQKNVAAGPVKPLKVGLYLCQATYDLLPASCRERGPLDIVVQVYAENPTPRQASHHLFDALRSFDRDQVNLIIAEGLPASGAGVAYMNRLRKAAGGGEAV
jgi:L-threonylcarbamoyladenylate synthase